MRGDKSWLNPKVNQNEEEMKIQNNFNVELEIDIHIFINNVIKSIY